MRTRLYAVALAATIFAGWAKPIMAEETGVIELAAPRAPASGEAVQIRVTVRSLPAGARLAVKTEAGEILGAVAPFGPRRDRTATTATIPVPRSALVDGRLRLRLEVIEPGGAARKARSEEVEHIEVILVPSG
jgi:hypothetical protein